MKRIVAIAVLIALYMLGINMGSADGQTTASVAFMEDSHSWSIAYRDYFVTRTARQGDLVLSIDESVYQPDQAAGLLALVGEDIQRISSVWKILNSKKYLGFLMKM